MSAAATVNETWRQRLDAHGLGDVAALLEAPPTTLSLRGEWNRLSKPGLNGRERWQWRLSESNGAGQPAAPAGLLFVKRYKRCGIKAQLDRILRQRARHSRGWWEFYVARELAAARVPAPAAIGYAECMRGVLERRSAVLLGSVAGDGFDRVWRRCCERKDALTRGIARHDVNRRLARFVAALHSTGFCHRDLYLCHIFFAPQEGGTDARFAVIDLARMFRPRLRRMRWLIKDLAQLDYSGRQIGATRTDRLRFLRSYLALERGAPRLRWYARRITAKADRIARREARKRAT